MTPIGHGTTPFKNVNNCLNTNIYLYLETSGGKSCNLYLNIHFSMPLIIRQLWQVKTVVFLDWYLICAVRQLLKPFKHLPINYLSYFFSLSLSQF
jgi:hypothetical protein